MIIKIPDCNTGKENVIPGCALVFCVTWSYSSKGLGAVAGTVGRSHKQGDLHRAWAGLNISVFLK